MSNHRTADRAAIDPFLEALNPPQYDAVTHPGGPMLVLAGAGSGKTRVITYRIAYLIQELGVKPWRILAVTFTNKAAGEMRHRVESLLGPAAAQHVWLGTFHGICARILRSEIQHLGYPERFVIYDRTDQISLLRRVISRLGFSERQLTAQTVIARISDAKQRLLTPDEFRMQIVAVKDESIAKLYEIYQRALLENGAVDFDDLLRLVVVLFQKFPEILQKYQQKFDHILVDEYQDTNKAQYLIVRGLADPHRNLCVVGDDDQSIYSWRGADLQNILGFTQDWPKTKEIRLEQNYRSTGHILGAAGGLIAKNQSRKEKSIWTAAELGEPVRLIGIPEESSEANWVAARIDELCHRENLRYSDFAIFYRTNAQSRSFEESLKGNGIPYTVVGGMKFYDRKEIKDILAYLRLIVSPQDRVAFMRVINLPRRGIGDSSVEALIHFSDRMAIPIVEAAARARECPGLAGKAPKSAMEFGRIVSHWRELVNTEPVDALLRRVLRESGYEAMLEEDTDPQSAARLENIQELVSGAVQSMQRLQNDAESPPTGFDLLALYLEEIALITDVDVLDDTNRVCMMTLHTAKGLEFPVVFLTGFEQGLIPHINAVRSDNPATAVEEERRLCYVGMTRAQRYLFLTYTHTRMIFGQRQVANPSTFLPEIPREHVKHEPYAPGYTPGSRMSVQTYQQSFDGWDEDTYGGRPARSENLQPGDRVHHRTFGQGVIVEAEPRGGDVKLLVDFLNAGQKTLIQSYAKLKKI